MTATSLSRLLNTLKTWFEKTIVDSRMKLDAEGRTWICKSIGYKGTFKLDDLNNVTDRDGLNGKYNERFAVEDAKSRKGISAIKAEISALYSFQKCFTQRFKGRMHFYRDDMSQKGRRNMATVGRSFGIFSEFKQNLDS
jgi:hypothetical protein